MTSGPIMRVDIGGEALEGGGKPDLLRWPTGTDSYAAPTTGSVTHDGKLAFIRVGSGGALVSINDAAGQEKPYIVPPNYWREIVVPVGVPAGARIVAKNLVVGMGFSDLFVEVR